MSAYLALTLGNSQVSRNHLLQRGEKTRVQIAPEFNHLLAAVVPFRNLAGYLETGWLVAECEALRTQVESARLPAEATSTAGARH